MANNSEAFKKKEIISTHITFASTEVFDGYSEFCILTGSLECLEEMMELHHYQKIFSDIAPLCLIKPVFTLLSKQHNHTDLVY